jgi:glucose/arabinose dehydrogenase
VKVRTRSTAIIGTICLVASLALTTASADEPAAPRQAAKVTLKEVATAQNPIAGAAGPGGTVWIAERAGTVRVLDDKGLGEPVLDISADTTTDGERGLLGIAFDKKFAHFYISFTNLEGTSTVDEFAVRHGKIQPDTRRTVLTQTQPYSNHNGGDIRFGPDGYLYIALGDGGAGGDPHGNGQNLDTLLGKVLRIDPQRRRAVRDPAGQPVRERPEREGRDLGVRAAQPVAVLLRRGHGRPADRRRRPERLGGDRLGPGDSKGGENYGWSSMEGTHPFRGGTEPANHVPPVHEYDRTGLGCSVTGGYVYRGKAIPALKGQYVFSDYCDGTLRALRMKNGKVTGESDLGVNGGEVVSFVQDGDGELYVLNIGGSISRVDPA